MSGPWEQFQTEPVPAKESTPTGPWEQFAQKPIPTPGVSTVLPEQPESTPIRFSLGDRFGINATEGFRDTLAGAAFVNVKSGVPETGWAKQLETDIATIDQNLANPKLSVDARRRLEEEKQTYIEQIAQMQQIADSKKLKFQQDEQIRRNEYDALPSAKTGLEAATALSGVVVGSLPSPETLVGTPAAKPFSMGVREIGKAVVRSGSVNALVNMMVDPVVQNAQINAGMKDEYDPMQTIERGAIGMIVGGATGGATSAAKHVAPDVSKYVANNPTLQSIMEKSKDVVIPPWELVKDFYTDFASPRALNNLLLDKTSVANELDAIHFGSKTNAKNVKGRGDTSAYVAFRDLPSMSKQLERFLTDTALERAPNGDWVPTPGVVGLKTALQPALDDNILHETLSYIAAQRMYNMQTKHGKSTGYTNAQLEQALNASPEVKSVADRVNAQLQPLMQHMLRIQRDAGLIDNATMNRELAANPVYIPLYKEHIYQSDDLMRRNRTDAGTRSPQGPATRATRDGAQDPDLKFMPFYEGLTKYFADTITAIRINEAKTAMYNIIDNNPMETANVASKIDRSKAMARYQVIHKDLVRNAVQKAGGIMDTSDMPTDFIRVLTLNDMNKIKNGAYDIVYRDGKADIYQIKDMSTWRMMQYLNRNPGDLQNIPILNALLTTPKQMVTKGITMSPPFLLRTFQRDQVNTPVYSKAGFIPVYDGVKGYAHMLIQDEKTKALATNGLHFGGIIDSERRAHASDLKAHYTDRAMAGQQKFASKLKDAPSNAYQVSKTGLKAGWESYTKLVNAFEMNARMQEGRNLVDEGYSFREAGFAGREVGVDMSMQGSSSVLADFASTVPFFNPAVQGLRRLFTAVGEDPIKFASKTAMMYGAPGLVMYGVMSDLPDYNDLQVGDRIAYWHIPHPNDVETVLKFQKDRLTDPNAVAPTWENGGLKHPFIKILRGYDVGAYIGGLEAAINSIEKSDGRQARDAALQLFINSTNAVGPPQLFRPGTDLAANRDWKNNFIVPPHLQDLNGEFAQFAKTPFTRPTATEIAKINPLGFIGVEKPIEYSYILDGYLKGLYAYTLDFTDELIRNANPEKYPTVPKRQDETFFGRMLYTGGPLRNSRATEEFYKMAEEAKPSLAGEKLLSNPATTDEERKQIIELLTKGETGDMFIKGKGQIADLQKALGELSAKEKTDLGNPRLSDEEKIKRRNEDLTIRNRLTKDFREQDRPNVREKTALQRIQEWFK